jgi:two-component system OmpR family response regulator
MRILVVEDEPKIAAAVKKGLEQERFSVDVVSDGDSGLSYGASDDYDAIVLDRMLPGGMDGADITAKLREDGVKTPILMLTAKDQVPQRVEGLNAGADDYLVKPFAFDELVARLRALLRRPSDAAAPALAVGGLTIEPSAARVTRDGTDIQLTAREFSLLEYLMRNAGQVVSKDKLIQHVWSDDDDILPNTVEVYMGYLRAKIDKPFKTPLIHTVRGFGYKVAA